MLIFISISKHFAYLFLFENQQVNRVYSTCLDVFYTTWNDTHGAALKYKHVRGTTKTANLGRDQALATAIKSATGQQISINLGSFLMAAVAKM